MANDSAPKTVRPPQHGSLRRRWLPRGLLLLLVFLIVYLLRAHLLGGLASLLVVEDPGFEPTAVLLVNGDRVLAAAVEHLSPGACEILLVRWKPGRLETYGVVPSRLDVQRRELLGRNVLPPSIHVLPGVPRSDWEMARELKGWLQERPDARVLVLCARFSSRRMRLILCRVLGEEFGRVGVQALPHREYDEANWWRHKEGLLDFLRSSVQLSFVWAVGEGEIDQPDWDPEDWEESLR